MINKQSSNDEVLHHLKQTELMLMTSEEEQGLNKILEIEDMLKSPKVEYWLDDGFFSDDWLSSTSSLMEDVKKRLLKNHVIKEHLAQCRGFVAYNILMSKLENNDMRLMYQNGEWFFVFLNERKEQESWVNQRFNTCFFNSSYEKRFIELMKETNVLEINKAWIYQREDWFYSSELFDDLNSICKKLKYDDIKKSKFQSLKVEEDLPPIEDEVNAFDNKESVSVSESVVEKEVIVPQDIVVAQIKQDVSSFVVGEVITQKVEEQRVEVLQPKPVHAKSSVSLDDNPFANDDVPFVPDTEEYPPIEDIDDGGLFPPKRELIDVIVETQNTPIRLDLDADIVEGDGVERIVSLNANSSSEIADFADMVEESLMDNPVKEKPIINRDPVIAKAVSISPITQKVVKPAEVELKPARALFGSKGSLAKNAENGEKKKGFSPLLGGKKIVVSSSHETHFEEEFSGSDD